MYEYIQNIIEYLSQQGTQQYVAVLVGLLAPIGLITVAVLAVVDILLGYVLGYIHEDHPERRVIRSSLSYKGKEIVQDLYDVLIDYFERESCGYIWSHSMHQYPKSVQEAYRYAMKLGLTDSSNDLGHRKLMTRKFTKIKSTANEHNLLNQWAYLLILVPIAVVLYFTPLVLLVTAGTVYALMRTARFCVRLSKKFNKHDVQHHEKSGE